MAGVSKLRSAKKVQPAPYQVLDIKIINKNSRSQ
jgi:hypothetical protein